MTFYDFRMTFEVESHTRQMASSQVLWQIISQIYDFHEFRGTFSFNHSHLDCEKISSTRKKNFFYSK